jgi:hypothetical protein
MSTRPIAALSAVLIAWTFFSVAPPLFAAEPQGANATSTDAKPDADDSDKRDEGCRIPPEEIAALNKSSGLPTRTAANEPTPVKRAAKAILSGPDFNPEEVYKIPTLKRKKDSDTETPKWMKGLEGFFRMLAEVLRAGVWVFAGLAVILLLYGLHYWWRVATATPRGVAVDVPASVAGLDIRPESLPDDVGAAARAAWTSGNVIGALSLLYRGALSALVVRFGAAIRASFTEQECLRAARSSVKASTADYFQALTRVWLHAVYAKRNPDDVTALSLCDEFNKHFAQRPAQPDAPLPEGAAA